MGSLPNAMEIKGSQASAIIFLSKNETNAIDDYAVKQLKLICDNSVSSGQRIRVMPDVHPGKVGTIGLTMTVGDSLMPNLTGIDIGCGMTMAKIKTKKNEYEKLDVVIRENVPSGSKIRKNPHRYAEEFDFDELICSGQIKRDIAMRSMGSLGGGNHFIEIDRGEDGSLYLTIHSGSRHLGKEVTEHYLNLGQKILKESGENVPYELTYLTGDVLKNYLHDVQVVQRYASLNRQVMIEEICRGMKYKVQAVTESIHNYVDERDKTLALTESPILRKGAISALKGEDVIIPINMRDGIIIGKGKGNMDWNYSAPHGSGRIMKREDVASHYTVSAFKKEMKGIYSPSVGKDTLDEAPFAYRSIEDMLDVIGETVDVTEILKPVYNFKADGR